MTWASQEEVWHPDKETGYEFQNNRIIMLNWKHWGDLWEAEKDANNRLAESENLKRKWLQGGGRIGLLSNKVKIWCRFYQSKTKAPCIVLILNLIDWFILFFSQLSRKIFFLLSHDSPARLHKIMFFDSHFLKQYLGDGILDFLSSGYWWYAVLQPCRLCIF